MDKRYQVFVSSTYEDLQDERREVMQALLELDCIPAGMELFPASNEDQWTLIKRIINDCDYYIVIIGGRYGSTNEDGMSYTEMEYRYANKMGKPIIAFLHKSPENIISKFTEQSLTGKERLNAFRSLAQKKMVKYWTNASELGSVVSRSMVRLIKQFPAIGWVKSDSIVDESTMREILKLKHENEDLQNQLRLSKITAPAGTEKLSQGEDTVILTLFYKGKTASSVSYDLSEPITVTWNNLFAIISPHMTIECTENTIMNNIVSYLKKKFSSEILEQETYKKFKNYSNFHISNVEFQSIKVQFKALGLITKSVKSRSVKDTSNYWTLTEYGDFVMTQLIARKRA